MKELEFFHKTAENPNDYAKKWKKETNGKIAGFFCSYTPCEIITAAGVLPFRIFGTNSDISLSNAHLQSYSCSLVRGALEDALSKKLDFLENAIFPHTCDSIQRLSDTWRINAGFDSHIDILLPVKLNTESAKDYIIKTLKKFRLDIEKSFNVKITDKKLEETILLYNDIRALLKKLYILRLDMPDFIGGSDLHAIFKASMVMDRNIFLENLSNLVKQIEAKQACKKEGKKKVVLSGGICSMPDIYETIEYAGGIVAADDLCTGMRYCDGIIDTKGDPIEAIAKRYIERINCPSKHSGIYNRGENLIKIVKESCAKGVIFIFLKFCEPHLFDYPYLKEMLKKEKIPSILFEIEENMLSSGQLKTRIEAFIEMIGD
jgi:bcr-type benzoyl-CoA reductase subunit C